MRKRIVIPSAGEIEKVNITGRSLVIESAGIYERPTDVPTFRFEPSGETFPIYPRSTYQNPGDDYNSLIVTGTAASAGDVLRVISVKDCLNTEININFGATDRVDINDTFEKVIENTATGFLNSEKIKNNDLAVSADVYVGGGDCLAAFNGIAPNQSDPFGKLLKAGNHYKISGQERVDTVKFIARDPNVKSILTAEMDF